MADPATHSFSQIQRPGELSAVQRTALIECWIDVANAGGAVGFPFPPVKRDEVIAAADSIIAGLGPERSRLVIAKRNEGLVGWLHLSRHADPLVAHWGVVSRVQTHSAHRGAGVGSAMMHLVRRIAREEMGLEQLRLAARGGAGLTEFYERLGWVEIGRWSGALRFGPGDDRDEVLMRLAPL
jgi:GNAT superfamily N-acetyltransferase